MPEVPSRIIRSDVIEVDSRLHDFGWTRDDVRKICMGVLHGRSLASGLQPKTAEGQLKYIFGVEALRVTALASTILQYEPFSKSNIEGVFDSVHGRKVMFQMVDQACGSDDPQPKSRIGTGKEQFIVDSRSPRLFPEMEEDDREREAALTALNKAECWYVMVSVDSNDVLCCELSRPKMVTDEKFDEFYERIKIFQYGEFDPSVRRAVDRDDDSFEITPQIIKR